MIRTLRMSTVQAGVTVGLLLSFMYFGILLERCGDIELNPGPPKTDLLRQTRLSTRGGSAERKSTTNAEATENHPGVGGGVTTVTTEPTLIDVMSMLTCMNSKFDQLASDVHEEYINLKGEVEDLKGKVGELEQENKELKSENVELRERVEKVELKADDLEGRSKRNNLIFYGIPRQENEPRDFCEGALKDLCVDKLDMVEDISFDRAHRLNAKPDSPIIARCTFYKDKEAILAAKKKLKGSDVFVGEDYSYRVRQIRKKLSPHLVQARKEGKKAVMIFDHIMIEGKKYFLDGDSSLKEKGKS